MIIGKRFRSLRVERKLTQGDIEQRTGLLRCYISRVENGHTVPGLETLEKMAGALEIPLYLLLCEGEELCASRARAPQGMRDDLWGSNGKDSTSLAKMRTDLARMNWRERLLVMSVAAHIANRKRCKESPRGTDCQVLIN